MNKIFKNILTGFYPKPIGIAQIGSGSAVLMPRKIEGASRIKIGSNSIVGKRSWIAAYERYGEQRFTPEIRIGEGVRIGSGLVLTAVGCVIIEDGCLLSENVFITDHSHGTVPGQMSPSKQHLNSRGPVRIGRHCFIGIRAVIMPGVTLGDYCVVGANSVVTSSFPERSVVAGVPARIIKVLPEVKTN